MNKIKLLYEQPSCDILVVRFEENIMSPGSGLRSFSQNDDNVEEQSGNDGGWNFGN